MFWFGRSRHERALAEALATSLDAVRGGTSTIEEALTRFPALAAELEPLLRTAARLDVLARFEAPDDARVRARYALLAAAARSQATSGVPIRAVRRRAWLAFVPAVAAALIFALIAVPVIGSVDSGSVPGDWNYGLKRATERVRLALTVDTNDRRMLRLEFANRRLDEIERLSSKGVQTQAPAVKALIVEYDSDVQQVQTSIASSSSAVPAATAQQLDSIDSRAQQVLTPLTESAPASAPTVAQDAQDAVVTTHAAAATAQEHKAGHNQHEAPPTAAVEAPPTGTPAPAPPTPAPTASPVPTAPPTATTTATTTPAPSATAAPTSAPAATQPPAIETSAPVQPTVIATSAPAPTRSAVVLGASPAVPVTTPVISPTTSRTGILEPAADQTPSAGPSATPVSAGAPLSNAVSSIPAPTPIATRTTSLLPVVTPVATPAPLLQNLVPGDNAFTYTGSTPTTIDAIVASVVGNVVYVAYPSPAGVGVLEWFPGGAPVVIAPGTHLVLHMKAAATLILAR